MDNDPVKIVKAKPSASILLIRDGHKGLEVLMVERAKTIPLAPGAYVFPGGKVENQDSQGWRWHGLITGRRIPQDLTYRIAGLRELYEEASVLHLEDTAEYVPNRLPFYQAIKLSGLKLDTDSLVKFAHWKTPPHLKVRLDTHFYLAPCRGQEAMHDGYECISSHWGRPQDILASWKRGKVSLLFPTRLILSKLARANSVATALRLARQVPPLTTMPVLKDGTLTINRFEEYGVVEASEEEVNLVRPVIPDL